MVLVAALSMITTAQGAAGHGRRALRRPTIVGVRAPGGGQAAGRVAPIRPPGWYMLSILTKAPVYGASTIMP